MSTHHRPRRAWSPDEDALLRARYPHELTARVARDLGREVPATYRRATKLGLKKSAAYLASPEAQRLSRERALTNPRCIATRFKPGQVPRNKGLRRPGWSRGRMAETQFKKGARPHTTVPVGTEVERRDGYIWVKVTDDQPLARRNWKSKHQAIYEAAHGPIPPKHVVTFRDRNRRNFALENLELVSRAAVARRNGIHRYPPEIVKAIQLRGALVRQINKRQPPVPARRGRPPKSSRITTPTPSAA